MKQQGVRLHGLLIGLFIIAAGVLLLFFNIGVLPIAYKSVVFSWQMLLIALGTVFLFNQYKFFLGIFLILLGGFFILPELNVDSLSVIKDNKWPIFIILWGIFMLFQGIFGKRFFRKKRWADFGDRNRTEEMRRKGYHSRRREERDGAGYIDRNYVFGGSKEKVSIKGFKGGDINCVFGGLDLDLMESELAEGVNILEVNAVMGGVVLHLPAHWKVEIRKDQVFGNFSDNRPKPAFEVDENRVLIIEASCVFGGGEIK